MSGAAIAATGCASSHSSTTHAPSLERADLVAVSRALASAERSVASEVAAAKAAWPLVANGLPARPPTSSRPAISAASGRASALAVPGLFEERQAASLTGPSSSIAGLFRAYSGLSARGWQLIDAAVAEIEHGSPASARFARANAPLYIESVYDAHFGLAQVGKHLMAGYEELGGAAAFGASLTRDEVDRLADTYSEANDRLHPHPSVKLGS